MKPIFPSNIYQSIADLYYFINSESVNLLDSVNDL